MLGDRRCWVGAAVPELVCKCVSQGERVLELVLGTDPLQASARTGNEANHQDSVMTRHMPGGKPGSVVKTRMAATGTCVRFKGETVTSVSGASSTPALAASYPGWEA